MKEPCQRKNHYNLYEEQSKRVSAGQFRLEACPFYHTPQEDRSNVPQLKFDIDDKIFPVDKLQESD